jgi:hypothetical protein
MGEGCAALRGKKAYQEAKQAQGRKAPSEEAIAMLIEKHFVTFFSPGTFVAETSSLEIESWDIERAKELARGVKERYGAVPYGFRFSTRSRSENDLDSHETNQSPMYYLGGEILTLDQIKERNDPKDRILIINMESNGWDRIVVNHNSYAWTQPLEDTDVVLDFNATESNDGPPAQTKENVT